MQKYLTAVLCLILDKVQTQGGQTIEIADFFLVKVVLCNSDITGMDSVSNLAGQPHVGFCCISPHHHQFRSTVSGNGVV